MVIESLSASGTYYIVVFDGDAAQEQRSKYTLAVGEIEDFGAADLFMTLPTAQFSTKLFFGDYLWQQSSRRLQPSLASERCTPSGALQCLCCLCSGGRKISKLK